jgi:hypothetical protein
MLLVLWHPLRVYGRIKFLTHFYLKNLSFCETFTNKQNEVVKQMTVYHNFPNRHFSCFSYPRLISIFVVALMSASLPNNITYLLRLWQIGLILKSHTKIFNYILTVAI